jgi:hypothetical protein
MHSKGNNSKHQIIETLKGLLDGSIKPDQIDDRRDVFFYRRHTQQVYCEW